MTFRLAFGEKSFDQLRSIARSRFFQRTGSGFDHIGEGEKSGFWRLGNRSRVTERGLADGGDIFITKAEDFASRAGIFFMLKGALIEVPDKGCAVVFADGLSNSAGQTMVAGKSESFFDVGQDDETAHGGGEVGVRVRIGGVKVFCEVLCFTNFADVVVKGHGSAGAGVG